MPNMTNVARKARALESQAKHVAKLEKVASKRARQFELSPTRMNKAMAARAQSRYLAAVKRLKRLADIKV